MADPANHIFLPWVQPGVAVHIPDPATDQLTANQPSRVTLPVSLSINSVAVPQTARLYGPANVKGIDPQQVVRTEPKPRTNNFEPNYFAAIEFDRPDFPWLFTPAKADARGRLRPWLCLIVIRKQVGVELSPSSGNSLPALTIKDPAKPSAELPDLAESWVWAHAQMTGTDKSQIKATMVSDPARSVSRLLCPRRLEPTTEYLACVVPAFEVGRKAGLGLTIDPAEEQRLDPAWVSGTESSAEIVLPIYYSWEFRTAADGDFEELVRLLEPRELPASVGKRPMDISHPGFVIQPQPTPMTLGLEGALRVVDSESDDWPDDARAPFQTALAIILNTPWELLTNVSENQDPIVAPPIYGCWQAAAHEVLVPPSPAPKSLPFWLDELNLDPRTRVAAGMGTRVIQDQQEQLMASAWQQLGDIQKINQRMRQAQLSRAVNDRYHVRNFSRFSDETFLKIVTPAQSRLEVVTQSGIQPVKTLLVQELGRSLPPSVVSPALRKIVRPRGVINRQLPLNGSAGIGSIFNFVRPLPGGPFQAPPPARGAVTIDQVSEIVANRVRHETIRDHRGPNVVITEVVVIFNPVPPPGRFERVSDDYPQALAAFRLNSLTGPALASRQPTAQTPPQFFELAKAHQQFLSNAFIQIIFRLPPIVVNLQQSMSTLKTAALASLSPARTVTDAVMSSVQINSPKAQTGDELEPLMDAPSFPQPMYEALRDLSQDFIFPGLDQVPANTVQLLETNAKFIESFLVGLNTEMGRELLWRGYPTDQRGTYFQQFWDTRTSAQPQLDIQPINQWGKRELGTTAVGAGGDKLVLLIRGELLRRYPNTVIYAVRATENNSVRDLSTNPDDERHPVFRGTLQPDVTFVGFDLTSDEVSADPGWFFVLQQQPTEPRFGLDEAPYLEGKTDVPALATWNDLNWAHLAPDEAALQELGFVLVSKFDLVPTSPVTGVWGRNSAHMAYITRQLPVRVAIHATELLHAAKKPDSGPK
jgi:hypothetical protein